MKATILILAALLAPVRAQAQETVNSFAPRLPSNIFAIVGIRGMDYDRAAVLIGHGLKMRRYGWANRYLFVDRARQWPYDVTAIDRASTDWHEYEE